MKTDHTNEREAMRGRERERERDTERCLEGNLYALRDWCGGGVICGAAPRHVPGSSLTPSLLPSPSAEAQQPWLSLSFSASPSDKVLYQCKARCTGSSSSPPLREYKVTVQHSRVHPAIRNIFISISPALCDERGTATEEK